MPTLPPWNEVDRLLCAALEQPPAEQEAFVDRVAAGNDALHERLTALLDAAEEPLDGIEGAVRGVAAEVVTQEKTPQVGHYRLLALLGHGGMGTVYLAERDVGGTPQRVALKMVRPHLALRAEPTMLARFRQERAVLARLEHPHIARLLDGGETGDGVPYLAMEYVDGAPITAYCARRGLSLDERLRLVVQVARTVAFAHRHLVVHRDLKPSNILVAEGHDGRPHPKLLDFGIAKLLSDEPVDAVPLTRTGARPLTPEYAAPEQLLGQEVTTATDVFGLGVILYELLTDRRPFEGDSPSALERAVLAGDPAPPSRSTAGDVAAERTAVVSSRVLRGDLDTICLKALRKEPEHRYGSAAELADDLVRYLDGLPIQARPATMSYQVRKFVARHRTGVVATAAVVLALLAGMGTALWQAREARQARDRTAAEARRAEQTTAFLAGLLQLGDPFEATEATPASALPDSGFARLVRASGMDPLLRAELLVTVADIYKGQGRYDRHEQAAAEAVRLLRDHGGAPLGRALSSQAHGLFDLARLAEAEAKAREAYALLRAADAPPEDLSRTAYRLGFILQERGRAEEAVALMHETVVLNRRIEGRDGRPHPLLVDALVVQFRALADAGRMDAALAVGREAMRLADAVLVPGSRREQNARFNYAELLFAAGRYAAAERLFQDVRAVDRQKLAADHPDAANTLDWLATLALLGGRHEEAAALAARAEAVFAGFFGEGAGVTAGARLTGALALLRGGDAARAEQKLRQARVAYAPEADPEDLAPFDFALGHALRAQGRTEQGAALVRAAERLDPAYHRLLLTMMGAAPAEQ